MAWCVDLKCSDFDAIVAGTPELKARNRQNVVAFDAAAVETIEISFVLPPAYASGSNVTGTLWMYATSGTSNTVRARLAFERGNTDIDADSFDTAVEANATANGTSGILFSASFTLANGDLDDAAAGDNMRVQISRVGTDGTNDTMTGDAEYLRLVLSQ